MEKWPKQTPKEMNAFYGNPDADRDFVVDRLWEKGNIVKITPPYPLRYPVTLTKFIPMSGLRVHKKCAASLTRVLTRISLECTKDEIKRYQLDVCGGAFNFRYKRGSSTDLSIHSWGAAIDLSHIINSWGKKYTSKGDMMPQKVVKMFEAEGWTWGGLWSTPDAMHFQAANL